MSKIKKPVGRPKESIKQRLAKIKLDIDKIKKLYQAGWTDKQVADFIGVTRRAIEKWKKLNEFSSPLKDWKEGADKKVEQTLYKRAIGFEYDEVTYEKSKIGGLGVQLTKGEVDAIKHVDTYKTKVVTKLIVPDVTAEIFWLKNRQPDKWREKHEVEHSDKPLTPEERQQRIDDLKAIGIILK